MESRSLRAQLQHVLGIAECCRSSCVYSGLGAFFLSWMRWIGTGTLVWPISLLPLIGGFAGALFGVIFGYLTTRRAGTPFAMITLGIGEMVFAASLMFPGFFGGEGGITADRASGRPFLGIAGITFGRRAVYIPDRGVVLRCMIEMYALTQTRSAALPTQYAKPGASDSSYNTRGAW